MLCLVPIGNLQIKSAWTWDQPPTPPIQPTQPGQDYCKIQINYDSWCEAGVWQVGVLSVAWIC